MSEAQPKPSWLVVLAFLLGMAYLMIYWARWAFPSINDIHPVSYGFWYVGLVAYGVSCASSVNIAWRNQIVIAACSMLIAASFIAGRENACEIGRLIFVA